MYLNITLFTKRGNLTFYGNRKKSEMPENLVYLLYVLYANVYVSDPGKAFIQDLINQ